MMYELKTLLPQFNIQVPDCMYTLKNISLASDACNPTGSAGGSSTNETQGNAKNDNSTNSVSFMSTTATPAVPTTALAKCACVLDLDVLGAQIQQILKTSSNVDAVSLRQDKVLQQLNDLKLQLARIRATLGVCQKGTEPPQKKQRQQRVKTAVQQNGGLREEPLHDIVINGHPNFIPYGLLALKNAWKDLFALNVKTFTHSTMPDIGPEARKFEQQLNALPVNASKPAVNVTLIWKNCEHTEMISSPTMYVPIYGEVNIIRYLGRVGPEEYRYENSPLCNEIDSVLDICYQLLRCNTPKGRATMIHALTNRLQKQKYFGGEKLSIADIGVHSSLRRMPAIKDKDLTPALNEWRRRAQTLTMI